MCTYKELISLQGENTFVFRYGQQFYSQQCGSVSNCVLDPAPSLGLSQVVRHKNRRRQVRHKNSCSEWRAQIAQFSDIYCQAQSTVFRSRGALWKKISRISPPTILWVVLEVTVRTPFCGTHLGNKSCRTGQHFSARSGLKEDDGITGLEAGPAVSPFQTDQ